MKSAFAHYNDHFLELIMHAGTFRDRSMPLVVLFMMVACV